MFLCAFVQCSEKQPVPPKYTGDLPQLQDRGVLRVIVSEEPITYIPRQAEPVTLDYDIAHGLADALKLKLELVKADNYVQMLEKLLEGEGDIIASSLTITPDREKIAAFSIPYLYVDEYLITARTDSLPQLTTGDAFGAGAMTGWGKALSGGSSSGSTPGGLSFSSETATGVLGMDWERDNLLFGLAMSQSVETGRAVSGSSEYDIEGSLFMAAPYARLRAGERLSVWALAGTGEGRMSLAHGGARQSADIAMRLAAAGGRADLLRPDPRRSAGAGGGGGLALALKADAFFVTTASEGVSAPGVGNLAAARGDASRVRAVLEGSRSFALPGGGTVAPSLSLGLRHDGGDADTGTGVELGAGLAWSDPSRGLSSDLRFHGLAAHEAGGYGEWGVSGSLRLAPDPSGRGASLSMTPSWGAEGQDGRLWGAAPGALAPAHEADASGRLQAELGYGLAAFGGGFTGTPNLGLGLSGSGRDWRLGWRLTPALRGAQGFEVNLDATRREPANDNGPVEHGIALRGAIRW